MLLVTPWSEFWDHNYFVSAWPAFRVVLQNNFVRGAVTGIGVLTVMAGLAELGAVLAGRREAGESPHLG